MKSTRVITTSSSLFLTPELPVFINRVSESFQLEQHKHEFVEINYVSEGSGYQYIEGQTIPVAKGDLFYLPLGVSHVFRPTTPMPERGKLIVYNCVFSESYAETLSGLFQTNNAIRRQLVTSYPDQPWLHIRDREGVLQQAFNTMHEEYLKREADFASIVQAEMIRVLVHLNRLSNGDPIDRSESLRSHTSEVIDDCAELIRSRCDTAPTITELAERAGLSERQFRRRFSLRVGMTYTDFVHKCRIEASCESLLSSTDKVASIAQRVGYQDIKFFNHLFKKKTGLTPSEYRKTRS